MNVQRTHRSPNYNARPHGIIVNCIVLHADEDATVAAAIQYVCDPASKVTYHCIVGRLGDVYELVDPQLRAWHAGVSAFERVADCNNYSVGVCLSNKNDGIEPFTEAALRAGAEYCALLMREFPAITLERITRHLDVALPQGRRHDPPVETFDLDEFRNLVNEYRTGLAG